MSTMTNSHRRSRRRTFATGSIAVLALLGAGAVSMTQAFADDPGQGATPAGQGPAQRGDRPDGDETAPPSPGALAVALEAAVAEVAEGKISGLQASRAKGADALWNATQDRALRDSLTGSIWFAPADGSRAGTVTVGIDDTASAVIEGDEGGCTPGEQGCSETTLPDGSRLLSFSGDSHGDQSFGVYRVIGDTTLSFGTDSGLSLEQLQKIASQPWWGEDLPREFSKAGQAVKTTEESSSPLFEQ
jgi:hypothetical protein